MKHKDKWLFPGSYKKFDVGLFLDLPGESKKKFMRLEGLWSRSTWPIFKTKMLIYQSKANLDEKILFGKITHL